MRFAKCLLLASMTMVLAFPASASAGQKLDCSRPLSLALHDHGLLYSSQSGEGIDKDVADELIRRSGCKVSITLMPRARIWQLIESGALDFSLSGIRSEARDRFAAFAWYFSNKYYLLVRNDSGVRELSDFEDDRNLRLGVIRSFRYSATANGLVDRLGAMARIDHASNLDPLYQILLDNRVQAMIIEPFDYPAVQSGRLRELTRILEFDDPPVLHGLIMSKKALPTQQQQAWRDLLDGMREDGTVERIFARYFKPELAKAMTRF